MDCDSPRRATVRIFIAPKFDERNLAWMLSEQRKMFVEMDKFVVTCEIKPTYLDIYIHNFIAPLRGAPHFTITVTIRQLNRP